MATQKDLHTGIVSLAASQAEILAAIKVILSTPRVLADALQQFSKRLSVVESTAAIKDLLVRALDR